MDEPERKEFGLLLRVTRTAEGLTLEEVADWIGVSQPTVTNWEKGKYQVSAAHLPDLERILGTNEGQLMDAWAKLVRRSAERRNGGAPGRRSPPA